MKVRQILFMALGMLTIAAVGCNNNSKKNGGDENADSLTTKKVVYKAQLSALNSEVTGTPTTGNATFVIANDTMTVTIDVEGAPAGIEHWQHFHGFQNDSAATCATADADANGDNIVDVVETEPMSGTTMVPFNTLPAEMQVGSDTYPVADSDGAYHYEAKIPMDKLKEAFGEAFGGAQLNLDKRVLYIHGVPEDTELLESVASIADIPAQITIPIACGKIIKLNQ